MGLVPQYWANSPTADGPQIARIAEAAKHLHLGVFVGYSERSGGSLQAIAKSAADPAGHYSRSDVTQFVLNRATRTPTVIVDRTNGRPALDTQSTASASTVPAGTWADSSRAVG